MPHHRRQSRISSRASSPKARCEHTARAIYRSDRCINFGHGRHQIHRWDRGNQSLTAAVHGRLIVDDLDLVIRAALDGVGLAYLGEDRAARDLDSGALGRVLEPMVPCRSGVFLHCPSR